jgi:hypothetical protein
MPIDWDALEKDVDKAVKKAADKTDEQLANKISSITRFTDDEIQKWFPDPADAKKLFDLMKVVNSAESRNRKIANIVNNAEKFGGIVLTLLSKL